MLWQIVTGVQDTNVPTWDENTYTNAVTLPEGMQVM